MPHAACRRLGVTSDTAEINRLLYNLRKQKGLEDHPTTHRITCKNQDEYRFASEIAARYLERRENTTLDRIICNPILAAEFDRLAEQLSPGYTSFEYRIAALSLRKRRRLKPEIVARVIRSGEICSHKASGLKIEQIPRKQGIYLFFFKGAGTLYLGEAKNLRERIRKHLEHSDRKDLARWLWEHGSDDLFIEIHVLPEETTTSERRALELELIHSRRPKFNILGVDAEI
ncbi:MAG TPA: GIY-YIG nuclease family protein [Phycisphaerae bacterium]|nr:GIY-YIG nuclease family protein [Phycisphaerae bacterium]